MLEAGIAHAPRNVRAKLMSDAFFRELIVLVSAGLGVAVVGLSQLVTGTARRPVGAAGWAVGVAGAGIGSALVLDPAAGRIAAALTAAISSLALVLGSPWVTRAVGAVRHPAVRAGGLVAVGVTLAVGGIVRFDYQDESDMDASLDWLVRISDRPATHEIEGLVVTTDRAGRVRPRAVDQPRSDAELAVLSNDVVGHIPQTGAGLLRGPASDACNCHGWVFTGGRYWLSPTDVERILAENGYGVVTDPRPGDLAIYRLGTEIAHTAVVRATGPDIPVLVEGKWGWMGVYLHPVEQSPYGKYVTFYRSLRDGHLLIGLGGRSPAEAGTVTAVVETEPGFELDGH